MIRGSVSPAAHVINRNLARAPLRHRGGQSAARAGSLLLTTGTASIPLDAT
jgi:hypothetical protein